MTYLVLASILLAVLYVGAAIWRRWRDADASTSFSERLNTALPDSISALVYELPRPWQWLWIVWIWSVSLLACIPLIEVMSGGLEGLAFLTLASLFFCGAMPLVKDEKNVAHYIFGASAGVLSQVCVAILTPCWLLAWTALVAVYAYDLLPSQNGRIYPSRWYDGKGVFLAEMICSITVYGSLLVRPAPALAWHT
jgi:hypothetical protein